MCSCSGSCDCNSVTVPRGPQGPIGETGPQGSIGNTGPRGFTGLTGPQGFSGVVSVEAPITNTGTSNFAIIGIDINELITLINTSNTGGGFIPTGSIVGFGGTTAPAGWMICGGGVVSTTGIYAALYAVIGITYGDGDGDGLTFNLPDLRTKVPVGYDFALPPFNTLGHTDGEVDHLLLNAEIPKHTHKLDNGVDGAVFSDPGNHTHTYRFISEFGSSDGMSQNDGSFTDGTATGGDGAHRHTGNTGDGTTAEQAGGLSHNNMQPYLVINYIIKL